MNALTSLASLRPKRKEVVTMTKLDKPPAYRWVILFIYMVPYCFFFMSLQASSAYGAAIQEEMDISATMASFMLTAAMIGFAFFGFIGGRMQSRFGSKRTMLCGIAVDVLASLLLIPFGSFYPVALALRFVQGVGGGIMVTPALMLSTTWFPVRQRALATGILIGVLGIGFTFATLGESLTAGFGLAWNVGMGTLLGIVGVCVCCCSSLSQPKTWAMCIRVPPPYRSCLTAAPGRRGPMAPLTRVCRRPWLKPASPRCTSLLACTVSATRESFTVLAHRWCNCSTATWALRRAW